MAAAINEIRVTTKEYFDMKKRLDICTKLIGEVRKYPWIFDIRSPDYRDSMKKERTWHAISKVLGLPMEDCSSRWKSIRDRYAKEVRMEKSRAKQCGYYRPSTWRPMKLLGFMRGHIRVRKTAAMAARESSDALDIDNGSLSGPAVEVFQHLRPLNTDDETQDSVSDTRHTPDSITESLHIAPSPEHSVPPLSPPPPPPPPPDALPTLPPSSASICDVSQEVEADVKTTEPCPIPFSESASNIKRSANAFENELVKTLKASRALIPPAAPSAEPQRTPTQMQDYFALYVAQRLRAMPSKRKSIAQAKIIDLLNCIEYEATAVEML